MNEPFIQTRLYCGKFELYNLANEPIQNQTLFSLVQEDTILFTNKIGTYFYTKPHVVFEEKTIKKYVLDTKTYFVQLPPKVPQLTKNLFTLCMGDYFALYNERFEIIHNEKLYELVNQDFEQGINQRGEPCLFTKQDTKVKGFIKKGMDLINIPIYYVPIKDYTFEGMIYTIELLSMKSNNITTFDIFDIFS